MSICVENVSYIYGKGTPFERAAIEDIDLTIDKGEFIGIIGHTGERQVYTHTAPERPPSSVHGEGDRRRRGSDGKRQKKPW